MKRILVLSILMFTGLTITVTGQSSDSFINNLIQKVNSYYQDRVHDNLYLHTDRSVYFPGDEMYIKAYVADAATLLPSERSDNFTLMMMDNEGSEVYSTTVGIVEGISWTQVLLPENLSQGVYHLIGIVMDENLISVNKAFNKPVFIADPTQEIMVDYTLDKLAYEAGDEVRLTSFAYGFNGRRLKNLKVEYTISDASGILMKKNTKTGKEGEAVITYTLGNDPSPPMVVDMTVSKRNSNKTMKIAIPLVNVVKDIVFFPEGGKLISGATGLLAFRGMDQNGVPADFSGGIYTDGRKVTDIATISDGIGITEFTPEANKRYIIKTDNGREFPLPAVAENGASIMIRGLEGQRLMVSAARSGPDLTDDSEVIVAIFRKGLLFWSAPGSLGQINGLGIPVNRIPPGVSKLVLFSKGGQILSERMFYLEREVPVELEVKMGDMEVNKRKKVVLEVALTGKIPENADPVGLSVSVVPEVMFMKDELMIDDFMMVETDILGNGQQFLARLSEMENRSLMLDALLLSSQWNGYSWDMVIETGTAQDVINESNDQARPDATFTDQDMYPIKLSTRDFLDYSSGIRDRRHPGVGEPHYKKQLASGVSVLEVIKMIKPYSMYGDKIVFSGGTNSFFNQQGALIIIDNQPVGQSSSILGTISPQEVESINISTNPSDIQHYTGLNVVGLIEITMKGSVSESRLEKKTPRDKTITEGMGRYMEGYPDYSLEADQRSVISDHRRLIYWKPDLSLNNDNRQSIEFYTPDISGRYAVTVQGMVGMFPLSKQLIFEVR